jgi:hypothetical protein
MQYALTPYLRCCTIRARRASRCCCTPMRWLPLTRKDKEMHQVRLQASRPPPARHRLLAGWRGGGRGCQLPGEGDGKKGPGGVNTTGRCRGLPQAGRFILAAITSSYLHTRSHTHTRQHMDGTRPAPVELEYVPAMHAVHAEDPAASPAPRAA